MSLPVPTPPRIPPSVNAADAHIDVLEVDNLLVVNGGGTFDVTNVVASGYVVGGTTTVPLGFVHGVSDGTMKSTAGNMTGVQNFSAVNVAGSGVVSGHTVSGAVGVSSGGNVSAATTVSAGTNVIGGTGVTATTGNVTAVAGDLVATVGTVSAASDIHTTGGDIYTATGDIIAQAGNISATLGDVSALGTPNSTVSGSIVTARGLLICGAGQAGTANLVLGTVTITVPVIGLVLNDVVMVTRNTPGGVIGDLSVPTAGYNVGLGQFVINSNSALDTSTVNWYLVRQY